MNTHKISVTVDAKSIRVEPDRLVMNTKEEVHWAGKTARKFSIVFDGKGPFEMRELAHAAATSKRQPRTTGHFKYTVISEEDPAVRLDPVVIVEDPPTGTQP